MILIVGLGNPEEQYTKTRHNLGAYFIDKLKDFLEFPDFKLNKKANALMSEKDNIVLAKPQTFMNNSGKAVKTLLKDKLIVIQDEAEVKLGEVKISKGITSHGHNGVQSIIDHVKTNDFVRIRIGIDSNYLEENLEEAVLKKFKPEEKEIIKNKEQEILEKIIKTIENEK
ncbi:MAG: aminoacyl-tRNA hydrolase [Candidatus Pacebacteria bacterium]|nr:aminoacyl-tRNA hydrolase [Candidatus Paceibacterota bacterium]MDD5012776.1 aminoacyl-tRNA hydrolase [Candidatus Paceibacterota bacterium]